jgi:uncharacterized protein YyaL (SSP411 family)
MDRTADRFSRNNLGRETSPYLLQHKGNPVHWQPWSREVLDHARESGKPILLSIGYAACHWCHVMAHESFESEDIAALMNRHFVNIKVDREERPDLDTIYQSALALLGEHGGWPLTMFLTPDGHPFWGGTYFPPTGRYGRPGFPDVLQGIWEVYAREPQKVESNVKAINDALQRLARPQNAGFLTEETRNRVAERLVREIDPFHGGIGTAPKFPQVSILELLWRAWKRTGQKPYKAAVTTTLTKMSLGGIYDHLGGGFARYAVDAEWLVPHFEKMLYDNAQLIRILTEVWQETREPLYEARVRETVAWTLREMIAPERPDSGVPVGAFASTLDADSEGEEGRFYVWTEAEIDGVLGGDAAVFKAYYDVRPEGNWEGKSILNRSAAPPADPVMEERLGQLRAALFAARSARVRPGWDDKVLADWNGLMIAALAGAASVFEEPAWLDAASDAFVFVATRMSDGRRLLHSWRHGVRRHAATLDDYACMCQAALALFEATADPSYLEQAERWVGVLDRHYADPDEGGYFLTADDVSDVIVRTKTANDSAVPSGNGIMLGVLARLFCMTGKESYRHAAEKLESTFSGELAKNFFPLATLLNTSELLHTPLQIVVVGDRRKDDCRALVRAAHAGSLPNRILQRVAPGTYLPPGHPAASKGQVEGQATAYVCRGMTCSLPITDAAGLQQALAAV